MSAWPVSLLRRSPQAMAMGGLTALAIGLLVLSPAVFAQGARRAGSLPGGETRLAQEPAVFLPWICRRSGLGTPTSSPTQTTSPTLTRAPTLPPYPDLTLVGFFWYIDYDGCPWGGPGVIYVRLSNLGPRDAGYFWVEINNQLVRVNSVPALSATLASLAFSKGPVGGVRVVVDTNNRIRESDETNNRAQILFTAPPPCPSTTSYPAAAPATPRASGG